MRPAPPAALNTTEQTESAGIEHNALWSIRVARLCGIISAALGLAVLIGWYTHNLSLLRIAPAFVAMAYNTALCFFLSGLGLLAALQPQSRSARKLTLLSGVFGASVGLLTLSEYLFGFNLGIDQLFMKSYIRSGITSPGRMAFCTALCFSLTGIALLSRLPRFPARPFIVSLCGSIVVGLGLVALSGYFSGIIHSYIWGQFTRMAVHTATGFIVLGLGGVALVSQDERHKSSAGPRWLPIPIGVGTAAVTLSFWQALVVEEDTQIDLIRRLAAQSAHTRIGDLTSMQALLPLGELIGGLTLAALLAGAVALAQTARRQAEAVREVRDGLEQRVRERTEDLAHANAALEKVSEWQQVFLRDVLLSVTDGKLRLCDGPQDLPPRRHAAWGGPLALTPQSGLSDLRCGTLDVAEACRLSDVRAQDLVTAVNEAGMNAVVHAGSGTAHLFYDPDGTVQVWVEDAGMGITMENLPRAAFVRGFTTAGTLGHGLKMMLQTVDRLWLMTGPSGTTVVLEQDREVPQPLWMQG